MPCFCRREFPELRVVENRITDGRMGDQQQRLGRPGENRQVFP
jgi:hypothetical protein